MSKGRMFGAILLLAGSVIGAGMLGLPIMSGLSGFFPSLVVFFIAWAFMTLTGLLLVETNGWYKTKVNLITMVDRTLGAPGKIVCWLTYLFLFYSLLLAYIAGVGSIFSKILQAYFSISFPDWGGSLIFVILFGWIVFMGTRPADLWNRVLMTGKIIAFLALVFLGAKQVQKELLFRMNPEYVLFALPVLIISFGFHNMIPTLSNYLDNRVKLVRRTIILGGLFILVIYLVWQCIVLGIIPLKGPSGILASVKSGSEASEAIVGVLGSSTVATFATLFGFFAILTSFLAQALSLSHFLADGFKASYKKHEEFWIVVITLLPPLFLAILFPNIFLHALNFAGGVCAVVLFGMLPVLMVWKGRYKKEIKSTYRVFGGKPLLVLLFFVASFIVFFQLSQMFHAPYLPRI